MVTEKIQANFPLASLTTYNIGGPAEYFIAAETESELREAVQWAQEKNIPITILGGGSNILVNDEGVKGLVIKVENNRLEVKGETLIVGASRTVKETAELALEKCLSGIEWSIGIPGAMGGAIRGNAGAHGGSFDKATTSVVVFDTQAFEFKTLSKADCDFRYRHSTIKDQPSLIIWEITLELVSGDKEKMTTEMEEYREYRRTSQPSGPSAGCVFKNFLATDLEKVSPALVEMAHAEGKIRGGKIGAGYVVQKLGMMGYAVGGATISDKHANFVMNLNNAKAADVAAVMNEVRKRARETYGVEMEDEVQQLGF